MKEDESKTTKEPAAAAGQPESTQSVETAEAPDTQPETGGEVERPEDVNDAPRDGEGCEAVVVIVAETHHDHPEYARTVARSVKQNLTGVDALVVIMGYDPAMTLAQSLLRMIGELETERIILITDDMVILNPVTICEVGCRRGELTEKGVTVGDCRTPKLMHRSVLLKMLPEMIAAYAAFDPILEYDEYARPQVAPVIMRPWSKDNWLLPVVSEHPPLEVLQKWAKTQRFMFISRPKWPSSVVKFLEDRFPE